MGNATRNIIAGSRPKQNQKYSIIIPAAAIGSRMKKYGPTPLIQLNKTDTILSRQIKIISRVFRWYEIILVTGFQYEKISNIAPSKVKPVYNKDYEDTNTTHSIHLGLQQRSTDNVVIMYGDLIFNVATLNVPFTNESSVVTVDTMKKEEVGCNIDGGYVEHMFYNIENKWAQISYLQGEELELMTKFAANNPLCFGFEGFNYILNNKGNLKAVHSLKGKATDIDNSNDLKNFHANSYSI